LALALVAVSAAVVTVVPIAPGHGVTSTPSRGKVLFVAACGGCHTLRAAGTAGRVGPNLDDEAPSYGDLLEQITRGGKGMPAFAKSLPAASIRRIAAFVSSSTTGERRSGDD